LGVSNCCYWWQYGTAAIGGGEVRWLLGAAVVGLRSTTGTDKVKQLSAGPRCCQSCNQLR